MPEGQLLVINNADGSKPAAQINQAPGSSQPALAVGGTAVVSGKVTASGGMAVSGGSGLTGTNAWLYQYLEPTGVKAASVDGRMSATSTAAALTSATVYEVAMPIEAGISIANLTMVSLTAEATGTHAWVGIADSTNKVLAVSADQTGAAYFAANSAVTTPVTIDGTKPLVTTYTGLYYVFVCVVASGTMPTFASAPAFTHAAISTLTPIVCGSSLTGQSTPVAVGSSLGAITATAGHQIYAYAS
jgi:hypothetical protein